MKDNFDYNNDLRKRLPELKQLEGFPIGDDEDILALSNPPFYTACPNPYINEFIETYGKPYNEETDTYHREPFVGDVSEGKNNPVYNAHTYHTKVPHTAIEKYIEHYTSVGDVVLDGFCGTGMTGVAATLRNRNCILTDLSPIATFIAYNYNNKIDVESFRKEGLRIINEIQKECGWLFETNHFDETKKDKQLRIDGEKIPKGVINHILYSDVLICPFCNNEYTFFEAAVNYEEGEIFDTYNCPTCNGEISKRNSKRAFEKKWDDLINKEVSFAKQSPVLINYTYNKKRFEKPLDNEDWVLIEKIEKSTIPYWIPIKQLPNGFNTSQPIKSHGLDYVHQFYTKRNIWVISSFIEKIASLKNFKYSLMLSQSAANPTLSKMRRFRADRKGGGPLTGTLYVGSLITPPNPILSIKRNIEYVAKALEVVFNCKGKTIIQTTSAINTSLTDNSIDYIFTDPPFGDNLMYSELNLLWEAWLKVFTNNKEEAIINNHQNKSLVDYSTIMSGIFKEYYRVLKPKRWITVEFHNSKSSVWNSIQDAMIKSGFVIAQVSVLDKKQGSFKQVTASGAVKSDLVISAYKPSSKFEERFLKNAGDGLELDFIQEFLHQQPIRPMLERTEKMLYSKMLSYYIQHGYEVRYDAKAFYNLLHQNFAEEDGYWFNANQINSYMEYKKRMRLEGIDEIKQGALIIFVNDEKSALVWLHNFLNEPKSFSDIHTAYTQLANIQNDEVPDLKEVLEQNFIAENGLYRRPRTEPEHSLVIEKREKQLMRQFESLLIQAQTEKKKIKIIRKEAVLLGFEKCYKEKRFEDILSLASRLDKKILEESAELKEFVDAAEISVKGII